MVKYPEDWKVVPLGEVFDFAAAGDLQTEFSSREMTADNVYPIFSNAIENHGLYGYTSCPRYDGNTVTITGRGTLGHAEYRDKRFDAIIRLIILTPKVDVDCKFVTYWVNHSHPFHFEITSIPQLTVPQVSSTKAVFPPLPEQKRIAAVLGNVDKLIDNLSRQIEKKRLVKQGVMQDLLTGKKRLPGFKGEWRRMLLGDLLDYEQPQSYIVKSTEYVQDGVPVLTAGKSFILGYTNESAGIYSKLPVILFDDFLTVSRYVEFRFKVKSSAAKMLKLKDENNSLFYVFLAMQSLGYVPGDHQRHWISIFSKFEIDLPCPAEQRAIAKVLGDMDAEIAKLEAKHEKYRQLKQGLMNDLLTGKVRVGAGETAETAGTTGTAGTDRTAETAATLGPVSEGLGVSAVLGDAVVSETVEVAHG